MKKRTASRHGMLQCPSCQTYIKAEQEQCPFCMSEVRDGGPMRSRPLPRRSKALAMSLLGLTALGGVALSHCGPGGSTGKESNPTDGGATKDAPAVPPYGIGPQDSGPPPERAQPKEQVQEQVQEQAKPQDQAPLPPYGIPPDK